MQGILFYFNKMQKLTVSTFILIFAAAAYADGIPEERETGAIPASAVEQTQPVHYCQPRVNHPFVLMEDGRLLVAGGMVKADLLSGFDRNFETRSEIWDSRTGQWQELSTELSFDKDQKVYLNQLQSGQVLFFAVRERGEHESPEYQARVWDPIKNVVEFITPRLKPRNSTDIAVLRDGRVLLINGNDASADMWDSRSNTLVHHEVSELENSRWRILALKNGSILVMKEYHHGVKALKDTQFSPVLLWDAQSDEWQMLDSLKEPFRKGDVLTEMNDGSLQARTMVNQFQLPAVDKFWIVSDKEMNPLQCKEADVSKMEQTVAASSVVAQQIAPLNQVAAIEMPWQDNVLKTLGDNKWLLLALIIPMLIFKNVRKLNERQQEIFLKYANTIFRVIAFCFFMSIILLVLWTLGNSMMHANMLDCGSYQHNSKTEKTPFEGLKKFAACVDEKNGVLESMFFYKTKQRVRSIPSVPCRYLGDWISTRSIGKSKIRLTDDSRFTAESVQGNQNVVSSGSWAVVGDEILWFYDQRNGHYLTYEVNPILSETMREFTLAEESGEHTVFELLEPIRSSSCIQ